MVVDGAPVVTVGAWVTSSVVSATRPSSREDGPVPSVVLTAVEPTVGPTVEPTASVPPGAGVTEVPRDATSVGVKVTVGESPASVAAFAKCRHKAMKM